MQAKVWRPRSGAQLAADVVEKVLATGEYLCKLNESHRSFRAASCGPSNTGT